MSKIFDPPTEKSIYILLNINLFTFYCIYILKWFYIIKMMDEIYLTQNKI